MNENKPPSQAPKGWEWRYIANSCNNYCNYCNKCYNWILVRKSLITCNNYQLIDDNTQLYKWY